MHARVEAICRRWHAKGDDHVGRAPRGMLLVIGSADRLPLTGALVGRYDSNVGLARARAEQVKSRLATDCGVPRQQMLAVIAGPASTPERREKNEPAGFPDDRSVVVWALWNAAADAAAATATAAHAEK